MRGDIFIRYHNPHDEKGWLFLLKTVNLRVDNFKHLIKLVAMNEYDLLKDKLYFAKEAAAYLGISVQRLAKLTTDGKVIPLKKNSSGTLYHLDELEKRKRELSIFDSPDKNVRDSGMFKINTAVRQEALNFAVTMNILKASEKKTNSLFNDLPLELICTPINEELSKWSSILNCSATDIGGSYSRAAAAFSNLKEDDCIIKFGDDEYPELLARTEEAPRFLYLRGRTELLQNIRTVALVGSRQAGDDGKRNTERVARVLGQNGIIIVSGLAKGIDVTAHRSALANGFDTIAVIGTNLNQYYPSENMEVQKQIEKEGLVISQFSPATKTERWFFPLRDGVMSGLSQATVIMEAGETSGALKQAAFALKQGRLVLIPQNAFMLETISWPARLEKRGALRVRSPKEIIQKLSEYKVYKNNMPKMDDYSLFINLENDQMVVADTEGNYCADRSKKD